MRTTVFMGAALVALGLTDAGAALADTNVVVTWEAQYTTVGPPPVTGRGVSQVSFVLRADGTVEDTLESGGGKFVSKQKLGPAASRISYRVTGNSAIERRGEERTHVHIISVRVDGKRCNAEIKRDLRPGHRTMETWNERQKRYIEYTSFKNLWVNCEIR